MNPLPETQNHPFLVRVLATTDIAIGQVSQHSTTLKSRTRNMVFKTPLRPHPKPSCYKKPSITIDDFFHKVINALMNGLTNQTLALQVLGLQGK